MRADQALVERGLASSRAMAKRMIDSGAISTLNRVLKKSSELVAPNQELLVGPSDEAKFVSRAGLKLSVALQDCAISVKGRTVLDLGQSTGGFTDCLLQMDAQTVIGIDVGHDQLASSIRNDARVIAFEGCNIRHLDLQLHLESAKAPKLFENITLIVCDLSFISLALVLPVIDGWFKSHPHPIELLTLVKPQFEVGRGNVNKQGLVTNLKLLDDVKTSIEALSLNLGWKVKRYLPSSINGGDGNREFFLYALLNEPNTQSTSK
jgi:23S rRNA (cytidine1920-2'-O)/16S rRNA (cytidine1409-2'-O)-methyltransferase